MGGNSDSGVMNRLSCLGGVKWLQNGLMKLEYNNNLFLGLCLVAAHIQQVFQQNYFNMIV